MDFFDDQYRLVDAYSTSFDPLLVSLSIFIAITSSFTTFGVIERISVAEHKAERAVWVFFGTISMGLGIWAMHFIGTLGLKLPVPISYNLKLTLAALAPALLVSWTVLWLMMQSSFNSTRLTLCGIFLGAGIVNMHFIGTLAMEIDATIYYVPDLFILSILIAILFSIVALYIQFNVTDHTNQDVVGIRQIKGSIVMGFAVSGMYYTAMHATLFFPNSSILSPVQGIDNNTLAYIVSVVVVLILLLAIVIPFALRYRQMSLQLKKQEDKTQIAATAFQTHDAILITDSESNIIRANNAFTRITGYTEYEVLGQSLSILKSNKHSNIFYKQIWELVENEGQWNGEIWHKRKNGDLFPTWQTISEVKNKQGLVTHYISFFSDLTIFKNSEKEIERLAFFDPLTELPNRRLLNDHLAHELALAKRHQRIGALLFLDLDRFKHINDSLGHSVGDEILKETARRLLLILRESDTAIRLGGDEYVILISAQEEGASLIINQVKSVAEKILEDLNRPYQVANHELYISTSIGITLFTGKIEENTEMILKQADTAMYQAKDAGRNTFRFYQPSMQDAVDSRLLMEKNLRHALDNHEFNLYFQPQFSYSGEIVGVEALIRWDHPEMGLITPSEFLPVAEEIGLILKIDALMLQMACKKLKEYEQLGIIIPHVAINISPKQFHQPGFVSMVELIVNREGIDPDQIMLEITERVFLKNVTETALKMNELKRKGFSFAIDDFGTGSSPLSYLKHLPFDQIKIDQTFIQDLIKDPNDAAIVRAIIEMAKILGLNLIAEGVETEKHLEILASYGCNYYQGHYFSKPLPADDFKKFSIDHFTALAIP